MGKGVGGEDSSQRWREGTHSFVLQIFIEGHSLSVAVLGEAQSLSVLKELI